MDDAVCVEGRGRRTETGEGKTLRSEGTFQVLACRWLPWIHKARTAAIPHKGCGKCRSPRSKVRRSWTWKAA